MKWRSLEESGSYGDTRPLKQILAERKEGVAKYVPPDVQAIHDRTIAVLKAQKFASRTLAVGAKAPAFELADHDGKPVSSADLLTKGPLVLLFIRGRWCPFCVTQMEAMNYIASPIAAGGASLIAISPQTEKQAYFMHDQHKLAFPLLVDARNKVARQFGLVYSVPDEQKDLYRRTFVNLPLANGDDSWTLPIPATFILDRDATVLFACANEDYTERPEPLEILSVLEHIG
jgi:peroxiredoxin